MSIRVVPVEQGGIIKIITCEPEAGQVPKPTQKPDQKKEFFSDPAAKIAIGFLIIAIAILSIMGMDRSDSNGIVRRTAGSLPVATAINKTGDNVDLKVNKSNNLLVTGYYYFGGDSSIIYCYKEVVK